MCEALERIHEHPEPSECCTARDLWTDEHKSAQMLSSHLNGAIDVASRNMGFINRSAEWIASRLNICQGTAVAEFGYGPGLYTLCLARRGANVTGIDFSARSIAYAKESAVPIPSRTPTLPSGQCRLPVRGLQRPIRFTQSVFPASVVPASPRPRSVR